MGCAARDARLGWTAGIGIGAGAGRRRRRGGKRRCARDGWRRCKRQFVPAPTALFVPAPTAALQRCARWPARLDGAGFEQPPAGSVRLGERNRRPNRWRPAREDGQAVRAAATSLPGPCRGRAAAGGPALPCSALNWIRSYENILTRLDFRIVMRRCRCVECFGAHKLISPFFIVFTRVIWWSTLRPGALASGTGARRSREIARGWLSSRGCSAWKFSDTLPRPGPPRAALAAHGAQLACPGTVQRACPVTRSSFVRELKARGSQGCVA